ncbi:MAG TPA: NBR1-Ig-like domain-containing protein [Pyrinomonadaceae bacterium]|nr:NBR1-Ig-like domain-containing protein [Pyrinomonadaceae bacterium]
MFDEDGWVILKRESQTTTPLPAYNNAIFIEQSVPALMQAGESYDARITMRNTGYNSWTAKHQYRLALLTKSEDWGRLRVELPATVEPEAIVTFDFKVTAPQKPGIYSFKWGMIQDGVQVFGEAAPEVLINVTAPTP